MVRKNRKKSRRNQTISFLLCRDRTAGIYSRINGTQQRTKKKTEEEYQKLIENEEVCKEKLKELIKKQENIIEQIELAKDKKRKTEQKREEFAEFKLTYEQYLEDKRNLDRYQRRRKETEYNEKLLREKQITVEEHIVSFRNEIYVIQKNWKHIKKK